MLKHIIVALIVYIVALPHAFAQASIVSDFRVNGYYQFTEYCGCGDFGYSGEAFAISKFVTSKDHILYFGIGLHLESDLVINFNDRAGSYIYVTDKVIINNEIGELTNIDNLYYRLGIGIKNIQLYFQSNILDQRLYVGISANTSFIYRN